MRTLLRRLRFAFPLAILIGVGGYAAFAPRWERPPEEAGTAAAPLEARELRAVTLNTYKLRQPERVDRLLAALRTSAELMGTGGEADSVGGGPHGIQSHGGRGRSPLRTGGGTLPELIGLQEIESAEVVEALRARLGETHHVAVCECSQHGDGSLKAAVVVAASRARFAHLSERCLELGRVWPDSPRCAAEMTVSDEGRTLRVLSSHLAWFGRNGELATRLRDAAELDEPAVWLGDFNAAEGSDAYEVLTRAPLRDARPGAPATHYLGRRVDMILVTAGIEVVRGLDRRASFDALEPSSAHGVVGFPYGWDDRHCEDRPRECPVSDHLPEGAVLRIE